MRKCLIFICTWALFSSFLVVINPEKASAAVTLITCKSLKGTAQFLSKDGKCNDLLYDKATWYQYGKAPAGTPGSKIILIKTCHSKNNPKLILTRNTCNSKTQITTIWNRRLGVPASPSILKILGGSLGTATVLSKAPANNGGARIISYSLLSESVSTAGKTIKQNRTLTPNTSGEMKISGLTPGVTYKFRLTARNSVGISPLSKIFPPYLAPKVLISSNAPSETIATGTKPDATQSSTKPEITSAAETKTETTTTSSAKLETTTVVTKLETTTVETKSETTTAPSAGGGAAPSAGGGAAPSAPVLAIPAFTLSSSSEIQVVNRAAIGFTASSTGGTIASFAISATPAGMSFSTSTGALTGTPTSVATATSYTVTATNASGTATRTFSLTVWMPIYAIGDTGPGGGQIFYISGAGFNCGTNFSNTGSPTGGKCYYLEAASTTSAVRPYTAIAPSYSLGPRNWSGNTDTEIGTTTTDIGSGYKNTVTMLAQANGGDTAELGAVLASTYLGPNNLTDWYLPSLDELNQMCKWARGVAWTSDATICTGGTLNLGTGAGRGAAGFQPLWYWSSSEFGPTNVFINYFKVGGESYGLKSGLAYVRPIRAFGIATTDAIATLSTASTIKGQTPLVLGTPSATLVDAADGTVTISAIKSANTSNADSYITTISATNTGASVKVVKYTAAADYTGFAAATAYNGTDAITTGDFFIIRVTAQDATTILYYKITVTVSAPLSTVATLSTASTIKGKTPLILGTPSATLADATSGTVTITKIKGADTSNATSFITVFTKTDAGATVNKIVKYAAGASYSGFASATAYNGTAAITTGDFFIIKVTAADGTTALYYKITVTVWTPLYAIGDTGPGGGKIFYISEAGFNCGPDFTNTGSPALGLCHYLEAASSGWTSGGTVYNWLGSSTATVGTTTTTIGSGYKNTLSMITRDATNGKAGTIAQAFRGPNNLSDWYLPSQDELNQMCKWARAVEWVSDATICSGGTLNLGTGAGLGASGFLSLYWSSSEQTESLVNGQDFSTGVFEGYTKYSTVYLRPIRAFGLSPDATLLTSSTIKGQGSLSLGISSSTLADAKHGSVTISASKGANSTNTGSYITSFSPANAGATIKAVKYSSGADYIGFAAATAYNGTAAITSGDFFIIKVMAEDGTTVLYYNITVTVSAYPNTEATLSAATIKGQAISSFGTPSATLADAADGTVTITALKGADTTNYGSAVTAFTQTDAAALVTKVVKYAAASDYTGFAAATAYNLTDAITTGDFFIIKVTAVDATTILYYKITVTVSASLSTDATLTTASTIKGQAAINLGTPNANLIFVVGGSLTITAIQGANTTNTGSYITAFTKTDAVATVNKIVKYSSGADSAGIGSDTAYNSTDAITAGDFFIVKVTAQDSTVLYYKITVTVTEPIYVVGDTGPGGGKIFYVSVAGFNCGSGFTSTGSPTGGLCHYLEAAPKTWAGGTSDPKTTWSHSWLDRDGLGNVTGIVGDQLPNNNYTTIGLGYKNSLAIVAQGNNVTTAAGLARSYAGGSKNDWYLPTTAELNQMCKWARGLAWISDDNVCSPATGATVEFDAFTSYWSSSKTFDYWWYAWNQGIYDGYQGFSSIFYTKNFVRPVRAF